MSGTDNKRAMLIANSASMIDHFNKDNILLLKEKGYQITVAANFQEGNSSSADRIRNFRKELEAQDIEVIDLPIPRNVTQLLKAWKSIRILQRYLKKKPCQIIHTQTPFGGVVGRLAAKKARKDGKCKVIYFVHGFHFFKGAALKNYIIYYNIEKWLSRYTDCLITLNHEDFQSSSRKFKRTTVKYVPGVGINTDQIHEMNVSKEHIKKKLHIDPEQKIILNVAELIPRKNVETCLRAFAKANLANTSLVVCGKGVELDNLKKLAEELSIADKVYFPGYRTDILDIYHASDIFLFTSRQEGLPVAVMQAMAAGLPIIASDIRGNNDLLNPDTERNCKDYLVAVEDVDTYAERLQDLIQDPQTAKSLGQINYGNCKQYFDIQIVHEEMSKIYDELAL